jgi:hypothetical protein
MLIRGLKPKQYAKEVEECRRADRIMEVINLILMNMSEEALMIRKKNLAGGEVYRQRLINKKICGTGPTSTRTRAR